MAEYYKWRKKVLSEMRGGLFTVYILSKMGGIKTYIMWHTVNTHGLTLSFYLATVVHYTVFDIVS